LVPPDHRRRVVVDAPVRAYAASSATSEENRLFSELRYPYLLLSFTYGVARTRAWAKFAEAHRAHRPALMLDSGAFSAWQLGDTIDLPAYADWALRVQEEWAPQEVVAVSLDVIPGKRGRAPSGRDLVAAREASLRNGDYLRDRGLQIVEVYHQYEPTEYLDLLCDRRQPGEVLGLAPRNELRPPQRARFLESTYAHLFGRYGKTIPPCHGFAVSPLTAVATMHPWYSVDSASWVHMTMFGRASRRRSGFRGAPDKRTAVSGMRIFYRRWVLESWLRVGESMTREWAERGFVFDGAAA
jgi:hypothetical protein